MITGSLWTSQVNDVLSVSLERHGCAMVLRLAGELDVAAAGPVAHALSIALESRPTTLAADLTDVTFMDAGGLNLLLDVHERLVDDGRHGLLVRGASSVVRRVFEITATAWILDDAPVHGGRADESNVGAAPDCRLELACRDAEMSARELFARYLGLGGTADLEAIFALLRGERSVLDIYQQDVAIHALNERLVDLGRRDRLLPYASDRS